MEITLVSGVLIDTINTVISSVIDIEKHVNIRNCFANCTRTYPGKKELLG